MPLHPLSHPVALQRLAAARRGDTIDVLQGAIAIATHARPTLAVDAIDQALNRFAADVTHLLRNQNPLPAAMAHVLFDRHGFVGNRQHYDDPANSYIDQVIERRTGLPILLSLIYVETARRAGAVAHGIGLPGHFLAALDLPEAPQQPPRRVYVDPFNRGRVLARRDCRRLAESAGAAWDEALLAPTDGLAWLLRMLRNLHHAYHNLGDPANTAAALEQILLLVPEDAASQEELRQLYRDLDRHIARNN